MATSDSVKVEAKPAIRIRVRCAAAHADPWLRRLYIAWSVPAAPPQEGVEAAKQVFALALSDSGGYLSPLKDDLDAKPDAAIPLFPDVDYEFYFIRYPSASVPRDILADLNGDLSSAKTKWGIPRVLKAALTQTGVDKKKKPILEGVIQLEEDPAWFVPKGSDFYGGWVLFRDMPGTGSNSVNTDIQCPPLFDQVRRLQMHLGRMRYPIGCHFHPYVPEPWENTHGEDKYRYPNEGLFDICTWNAVLRFQRDARSGDAIKLNPALTRTATLAPNTFEPLPAAADVKISIFDSTKYLSTTRADPGEAFSVIEADADTVVETSTAVAIKQWLQNDLRKPEKILVSRTNWIPWVAWMQEDVFGVIELLETDLIQLAVEMKNGFQVNNALRDTRMSVVKPMPGQIIYSIHKSGFAFDMAMEDFVGPRSDAPLYFEKDLSAPAGKVLWTVYAPAIASKIPAATFGDYVEFKDSITPWKYDSDSPDGGSTQPPLTLPDRKFLNFTKICDHYLLRRIGAHSGGWQGTRTEAYTIDSPDAFGEFVDMLAMEIGLAANAPSALGTIDGEVFAFSEFQALSKYLTAWRTATRSHNPTPEVRIEPWTKEGGKVLSALRGKSFKGFEVHAVVERFWSGGTGSSGFPPPPPPPDLTPVEEFGFSEVPPGPVEGKITLSATAEFPTASAFTLLPLTKPAQVNPNSIIELPGLGHPAHMEWWHFQYELGFKNKKWGDILGLIGWTREGLLGKSGNMPIHGLYGMGYTVKGLDDTAR